jgi:arginine utilization protein RocB
MATHESLGQSKEHNKNELESIRQESREQHERLREDVERAAEKSVEKNPEQARREAMEYAKSNEKETKSAETEQQPATVNRGPISKNEHEASFSSTMKEIQSQMTTSSRTFSKVIHNKTVEQVSEVAGSTVARPNAILSGAVFAFLLTLVVYLVAKNVGYPLSGFESIGAFILGWIVGVVYDFLKVMITGRQ